MNPKLAYFDDLLKSLQPTIQLKPVSSMLHRVISHQWQIPGRQLIYFFCLADYDEFSVEISFGKGKSSASQRRGKCSQVLCVAEEISLWYTNQRLFFSFIVANPS